MSWLDTKGVGAALRLLYRPTTMFDNAFDFIRIHAESEPLGDCPDVPPPTAREAILEMRHAASRLSSVANAVIVHANPTPRQSIDEATDEAVRFDA